MDQKSFPMKFLLSIFREASKTAVINRIFSGSLKLLSQEIFVNIASFLKQNCMQNNNVLAFSKNHVLDIY